MPYKDPEQKKACQKRYYERNKAKCAAAAKKWQSENKEKVKDIQKRSKQKHAARIKLVRAKYRRENREKLKEYQRHLYATNEQYRIASRLRSRFTKKLTSGTKVDTTFNLIGCSITEVCSHLEQQFTDGMSWDNVGEWQIDHIKPLASFDLKDEEQQREAFHYTNLQPLWPEDNYAKGTLC